MHPRRRSRNLIFLTFVLALSLGALHADAPRQHRIAEASLDGALPPDLLRPEGKSRWDLTGLQPVGTTLLTLTRVGDAVRIDEPPAAWNETGDAVAWWYPDRVDGSARLGTRQVLKTVRETAEGTQALRIEVVTIGVGWLHLPGGPRETTLQRALIHAAYPSGKGYYPERLVHRWVDPRAGVVAEVSGPAAADGKSRLTVHGVRYTEDVLAGAADLKIYIDEWDFPAFTNLNYGWDPGSGTPLSQIHPGVTTMADIIALDSWDFSGNTTGTEVAQTTVILDSLESCNVGECGYTAGVNLGRRDVDSGGANEVNNNQITERVDGVSEATIWLRAGAQKEGVDECFGNGESRFCYTGNQPGGAPRTEVPLFVFGNQDANGFFFQAGDSWSSGVFDCEQTIFNTICGADPPFFCLTPAQMYATSCGAMADPERHTGRQFADVLKGGPVTLPSGHTFNALLMRSVADFCVYSGDACSALQKRSEVRTAVYLWQVPFLNTVVLLQSEQDVAADLTSWSIVDESIIGFGLFPPVSITVDATRDTEIDLSWNPGNDTHRIDGYKVYWDTDSGSSSGYGFNSVDNPGQVAFNGTMATISGLTAGTTYFVTVTSLSTFNHSSNGPTEYESLLFPTQVSGDPSFIYPVEVQAQTTGGACTPTEEIAGLTVDKLGGGQVEICWTAAVDPCLDGYDILGAADPASAANFTTLASIGVQTCWTGSPTETYFLVVARGAGGTGPWGHYGQ